MCRKTDWWSLDRLVEWETWNWLVCYNTPVTNCLRYHVAYPRYGFFSIPDPANKREEKLVVLQYLFGAINFTKFKNSKFFVQVGTEKDFS
jgi:hypothetical protein